ncbi:helix-turn-helix domain-containing protein [Streptomyces xanthochromogenes]|uniref:helix-turn-helix domain-containing protein n=1 Tax=Streptomyces xanthochromogenes TaxID=67384 RepID=UPI00382C4CE2
MGRIEQPVDETVPARGRLATYLRMHRYSAGCTYAQLSALTNLSPATLKRAASGKVIPGRETVDAIIQACGGDKAAQIGGRDLWRRARIEERGRRLGTPPRPHLIASQAELGLALVNLYEQNGAPSLREMQRRGGGAQWLALSSISRIIKRQSLPSTPQQMEAFLAACEVPARTQPAWIEAWVRVSVPFFNRMPPPYRHSYTDTQKIYYSGGNQQRMEIDRFLEAETLARMRLDFSTGATTRA